MYMHVNLRKYRVGMQNVAQEVEQAELAALASVACYSISWEEFCISTWYISNTTRKISSNLDRAVLSTLGCVV